MCYAPSCPLGFYSMDSISEDGLSECLLCSNQISDCEECTASPIITCSKCSLSGPKIYLRENSCVSECPQKEAAVSTPLNYCLKCTSLDPHCEVCNKYNCLRCTSPKILEGNRTCVDVCPEGKYEDFSENFKRCKNCTTVIDACYTCDWMGSTLKCIECSEGTFLKDGACVNNCGLTFYGDDKTCFPCSQVIENCLECSQGPYTVCTKCEDTYTLNNGVCSLLGCNPGQYLDESSKSCKSCQTKFPSCSECSFSNCLKCADDRKLSSSSSNCFLKCAENEYEESSSRRCQKCSTNYRYCSRCTGQGCSVCLPGLIHYIN
jgi:proprotein convertase subtilisin/kexin type 5